ncbi:MAG TPA: hypothetical protein ACHBZ9_17880, partial [Arsenophonus nasoniae]|uniref:hypothetical protein n=1 Tax=Arsenophonus nasoniae TaxID=638 RepID=UPI00387A71C5
EIRLEITLSEEILTGTKHNKSIPSPFCNKGWLLLLTLKAIQFPNHEPVFLSAVVLKTANENSRFLKSLLIIMV